ncbi:MAG: hydrogenase nickel incorporation protein HypB [Burkholderiaceae bacterium]|nr:hydrogenase nickel incorporation protein HypB [Burkholderiaceae bacterium]
MCTTCGCGAGETKIEGDSMHEHVHADGTVHRHAHHPGHDHAHAHVHVHADGTVHSHAHDHAHEHAHGDDALHFGLGAAHAHAPGLSQARMVQIERDILAKNDDHARANRRFLEERGIFALNLVSSPGSGKTTLLVETIKRLAGEVAIHVIEGDQQTAHDADRIRATGVRAIQVNTGKGCHLDAAMVERALGRHAPPDDAVLFIENVGNLVCQSAFDLGEAHKVVVLSVTEGEPLKYPDMFAASDLMLLNKVDLLPYLAFDVAQAIDYARRVNPKIEVLQVSATTGAGFDAWLDWIRQGAAAARKARENNVVALKRRVAELEARVRT